MTTGVVVMAYGTPASLDDVEAYYTHIRRGRPPEPHLLEELVGRYAALGGTSPLRAITEAQMDAVATGLGDGFVVRLGQKHAAPFIEDGVRAVVEAGVDRVVGVVLAPHYSRGSVGEYAGRLQRTAAELGVPADTVRAWADLPELVAFLAAGVRARLTVLGTAPARTRVLFTAHSLPERVLAGDPYPDELAASAAAVAAEAGLDPTTWGIAWQSAGRTADPWRGPDVLEVLDELAASGEWDGVVVCPQGFTADHLEVLYDLDDQAAERAAARGLAFARTPSLNAEPTVLAALARRVATVAAGGPGAAALVVGEVAPPAGRPG